MLAVPTHVRFLSTSPPLSLSLFFSLVSRTTVSSPLNDTFASGRLRAEKFAEGAKMRVLASGVNQKKASVSANDNVSSFTSLLLSDRDRGTYGSRFGIPAFFSPANSEESDADTSVDMANLVSKCLVYLICTKHARYPR